MPKRLAGCIEGDDDRIRLDLLQQRKQHRGEAK